MELWVPLSYMCFNPFCSLIIMYFRVFYNFFFFYAIISNVATVFIGIETRKFFHESFESLFQVDRDAAARFLKFTCV